MTDEQAKKGIPTIQQALDELRKFLKPIPDPDYMRQTYLLGIIELHVRDLERYKRKYLERP
jgi:hypothetical protein